MARYSSYQDQSYFGWADAAQLGPGRLAELFVERFPEIVKAGRGSDWSYVGWYVEMLNLTYPHALPIAYADWPLPSDCMLATGRNASDIRIPLPPPGWALDQFGSARVS